MQSGELVTSTELATVVENSPSLFLPRIGNTNMESPVESRQKRPSQVPDPRKGFDGFMNSSIPTHSSPRYSTGHYYRGGHIYNGNAEFNSRRSGGRSGGHVGVGIGNNSHVGSFSPHTVSNSSEIGLTQPGSRPFRDTADGKNRRAARLSDDTHSQNHALVDGKLVRILQRPLPVKGDGDLSHVDGDGSDKSSPEALQQQQQQLKRGHRKKTLSLNPEEREALENLVEEVIIGGLGEAIIDSDGTSSSDDEELGNLKQNSQSDSGGKSETSRRCDSGRNKDSFLDENSENRLKGSAKDSGSGSERNFSPKTTGGRNASRNNGKDYNRRGRENSNNRGLKETKRGDFRQSKTGSPEEEKEKPNAATVRGVNIYPAQLKVAIKHMDSLPPRFLRRLQTGSSRTVGNESILACLTLKSPSSTQILNESARSDDAVASPTDRDRGKSKQTQLQETKKTIRNLLCDLDQYTDETVVTKDDCLGINQIAATADKAGSGEMVLPIMPDGFTVPPPPHQGQPFYGPQFGMKMPFASPSQMQACRPPMGQSFNPASMQFMTFPPQQPPKMLSCEELEREMLHSTPQSLGSPPNSTERMNSQANNLTGRPPVSQFYPQMQTDVANAQMLQQMTPKKIQFSVDAPEFVSNYYMSNRGVSKSDLVAPTTSEPYYAMPVTQPNSEMTVQILHDNVHMPSKPIQFPMSMMPPPSVPPPNAGPNQEFVEMSPGNNSSQQPYPMVNYDMGNNRGLGMMRNTPSFMAPVSLQMAPPVSGQNEVVSPSVMDMNAMPYQSFQYVSTGNGYNTGFSSAPEYNQSGQQSYMTMPLCTNESSSPNWMAEVANQPHSSQLGWYPGYSGMTYANSALGASQQSGFEDALYANSQAYGDQQQMINTGSADSWSYGGTQLSAFEIGRQKVLQLLSEGNSVMVILIGGPEGDKLSLVSDLPMNGNGTLVLNTRNGTCNGNTGKMLQIHEWNIKQVMDAIEVRKSPIIIDNTYAQPWERERYLKLAELSGYHVEIIDSTMTSQPAENDLARQAVGDLYHGPQLVNSGDLYHGQAASASEYHGQQVAEEVVNSVVGLTNS